MALKSSNMKVDRTDQGKWVLKDLNTDEIISNVYNSLGEAYTAAIANIFTDTKTKEWLTTGINENLDSIRSALVDEAKQDAL